MSGYSHTRQQQRGQIYLYQCPQNGVRNHQLRGSNICVLARRNRPEQHLHLQMDQHSLQGESNWSRPWTLFLWNENGNRSRSRCRLHLDACNCSCRCIRSLNIVRCSHNNYRIVSMTMYEHRSLRFVLDLFKYEQKSQKVN